MKHIKLFENFISEKKHNVEDFLSMSAFDNQPEFKRLYPIWYEQTGIYDGMPLKLNGGKKTSNYGFYAAADRKNNIGKGLWMGWWDIKSKDYGDTFRGSGSGKIMEEDGTITVLGQTLLNSK